MIVVGKEAQKREETWSELTARLDLLPRNLNGVVDPPLCRQEAYLAKEDLVQAPPPTASQHEMSPGFQQPGPVTVGRSWVFVGMGEFGDILKWAGTSVAVMSAMIRNAEGEVWNKELTGLLNCPSPQRFRLYFLRGSSSGCPK